MVAPGRVRRGGGFGAAPAGVGLVAPDEWRSDPSRGLPGSPESPGRGGASVKLTNERA